ncbi:golgin subfamily B member 1-like [Antennarius striatus]|uniref:golgin subfamily B member 1-like n=1 Tax=Antennarius striatus TaxID=241820 RepID=UPI0035B0664A
MLKWFSGDEGQAGALAPGGPVVGGGAPGDEAAERLVQSEQLVSQLKELIREKDAALRAQEEQLKMEKETCEAKLSKLRLQNKAKVTSLNAQLEELKKQPGGATPTHHKKGSSEGGDQASRGKIVLLKKKSEELEQQLALRTEELEQQRKEVERQRRRGEEMDAMLTERDRKLAEKEAYIVHLQTALAGDQPIAAAPQQLEDGGTPQELQLLVQGLTRKVGESEERSSLLQEQVESLKALLLTEKEQFIQKENMYKQNIQTFKDIIIQKDNQLTEISQMHEQELFRLAAKSDASADLEQLLKALKQKLHEKEEVLLGKSQVIDVLQGEVDGRDQQITELAERLRRLQVERESLESRMEAEKHVMRAQLRDLMDKQQGEVQRLKEQHQQQTVLMREELLDELRRSPPSAQQEAPGSGKASAEPVQRIAELEAQVKQKSNDAERSEAKFLKMKAWSKTRIRQLEEELRRSQAGAAPPDLTALRSRITALEEEREENQWKVEQYEELQAKNEMLEVKLVLYEEQQRSLQADLETFTKRAASQASESGSTDDTQSKVLEWQVMAADERDRAKEEKAALSLRIGHLEEEREALETRQQELEEELAQAGRLGQRRTRKLAVPAQRSLQEDFEFDASDQKIHSGGVEPMEGENMGGWWPEFSAPGTDGLRSVVEELELERNQLQEQILSLEERCQELGDRLQLQARIETLQVTFDVDEDEEPLWAPQNESEKLQSQLAGARSQQSRDAEKHQLLVNSLNEQLRGLSDTQECLEISLIEKENTLAKTSEKLEFIGSLRESLSEKETQLKEASDKLLQTELTLENVSKRCSSAEKTCGEVKTEVDDLTLKLSALKEKSQKQEVTIETLQTDLDQTTEELDKLNSTYLEERAQLIHDLQSCEREIDSLKDTLSEKDKEISTLSGNVMEYTEQVTALKQELRMKEDNLVQVENALSKAEREAKIIRESQNADRQDLDKVISELVGNLKDAETKLVKAEEEREAGVNEVELLVKQAEDDKKSILELRGKIQKQIVSNRSHVSESESQITSLKEQLASTNQRLRESEERLREEMERQLQGKERKHQEELRSAKDKYEDEVTALSRRLEEQEKSEEIIRKQLEAAGEQREKFMSGNEKLSHELQEKSEEICKLNELLKDVDAEKKRLREEVAALMEEMELQKQNERRLQEGQSSLDGQINDLTSQREKLELELKGREKTLSDVEKQKESLESQISANNAIISGLQRDKEELTLQANELQRVLERSTHSNSEILLEKTNECDRLNVLLREREENDARQQERALEMTSTIEGLRHDAAEQEHRLRSELEVKEEVLRENGGLKEEVTRKEETVLKLREEVEALRGERSQVQRQIEDGEDALKDVKQQCLKHKDELDEANKTIQRLSEQIGVMSGLEIQISEKEMKIDGLLKEKETLTTEADDLKKVLMEKELSSSAGLLEKTNQCMKLSETVEEREEELKNLQEQVENLKNEVNLLNISLKEKEQAQQNQVLQLQDTVSILQEQTSVLVSDLKEKDRRIQEKVEECEAYQKEVTQQKTVLSQMQEEAESLRQEVKRLMDQTAAEITDLKMTVQKLTTENLRLTQEESKRTAEATDFKDDIQALKEQSGKLKAELQKTLVELSKERQEAETASAEKERLRSNLEAKDESLEGQQTLIQQVNRRVVELEEKLEQKANDNDRLNAQVSELRAQIDSLALEASVLRNNLEDKERSSSDYESLSKTAVENLNSDLKAKDAECESLKEKISHLEETVAKLDNALHVRISEAEHLNKSLQEKDAAISEQAKRLQDVQRSADEAFLFKTQFMESTELVTQLHNQIQLLSAECGNLRASADETQSAFNNLQEKFVTNSEELQDFKKQLSEKSDEVSQLRKLLDDTDDEHQMAKNTIETLKEELNKIQLQLTEAEDRNSSLSKEKDESLASHEASVSLLTVEIERLKSQHLQVVGQMNALTENLEQREMALHAINNQYSSQAKQASQLVSEIQKLEEQNKRLGEDLVSSKDEHQEAVTHLRDEVRKVLAEKEELEKRNRQIQASQEELWIKMQQEVTSEKEGLQSKVSAKDEELSRLKENVQKVEQILQDSEKEWLLVLDKEKQEKNLLVEQLISFENELKSKDVKVDALKQDLDSLQDKLVAASSAIRQGSDQLNAKQLEVSASRIQLEKVLASVQEKERDNDDLKEVLKAAELELERLLARKDDSDSESSVSTQRSASLHDMLKHLQERHQSEVEALSNELNAIVPQLQRTQKTLSERERSNEENAQQVILLKEMVEHLQTRLSVESDHVKDATARQSSLLRESQAKDDQVNCMSIQIIQQKELLAGLSQQLKDKDASIAQIVESASNERMKFIEEKESLVVQLDNLEQDYRTSLKRMKEISETKNSENLQLIQEKDALKSELAVACKEKDAIKKKLQAALILRKELSKKIQQYEKEKEESTINNTEVSLLQDKIQEAETAAKVSGESLSLLETKIQEKEGEILTQKTEYESQLEQLESEKQILEATINEKEVSLSQTLQTLTEKSTILSQVQTGVIKKEAAFEQERNDWMQKLDQLENEIKTCKEELKDKTSSAADLEKEVAQLKQEKATLQKKTQAALLARKETMRKAQEQEKKLTEELTELKEKYETQLCQHTDEISAVQQNLDKKILELEELERTSVSDGGELDGLRRLVEERNQMVEDLMTSVAEKENQCQSLSNVQTELENVKAKFENVSIELANKDQALVVVERRAEALKSKLDVVEDDLEKAYMELKDKMEDVQRYLVAIEAVELKVQALQDENVQLETRLRTSESALQAKEEEQRLLLEKNKELLKQSQWMKAELETTVGLVSQNSLEVLNIQKTLEETQQRLSKELQQSQLDGNEKQKSLDLLKQEKENASSLIDELQGKLTTLTKQLKDVEKEKADNLKEDGCLSCKCAENFKAKQKQLDEALLASQAQVSEKEELIAALEVQLKQQVKIQEVAIERLRTEAAELQKTVEEGTKENDQDNKSKISLLTRKLQAALVSRKELMKEVVSLKEEKLVLESSVVTLKQEKTDLDRLVLSLNVEKEKLNTQVDGVLVDNRSLTAACESLKLTIENITQQKQAFSCQLESLKDSQTDELSKWKLKHAELKQEYESLLQAYENVSSEMDKMRQLLEGSKRDRQEALRKIHKLEAEMEIMEKKARETEEESWRFKERMEEVFKEKQQKIEELEKENEKTKKELIELEGNHKTMTCNLTDRNQQLEDEISKLKVSTDNLKAMNGLDGQPPETFEGSLVEKKHLESNPYANNMQLKLDESLSLNNSLTAQIEAQKTEIGAQLEITVLLEKEKQSLSERIESLQSEHEVHLGKKEDAIKELKDLMNRNSQETISLNEKVRILEDDKSLLQEELENVQEISDKVKNENEYLETVILKNAEKIDELTESVKLLQTQKSQLSSQLVACEEMSNRVRQEKEDEQIKLVKEFEEKFKTVKRGSEGSKNVNKELQELLKEKHQETNQLQQNCIKYQEVILDLGSSLKSTQATVERLEKEVGKASEKVSLLEERRNRVEEELTVQKNLLKQAEEKILSIESERDQLATSLGNIKSEEKTKSPPSTHEKQLRSYMENQLALQQQIDDLQVSKDSESRKVGKLVRQLDAQELQLTNVKRAAETNEAKLVALSAAPEGAEATELWNGLYQKTLHEKDSQLVEQGFVIKRFLEDTRVREKELSELRAAKSRLERSLGDYSVAAAAQQRQLFVLSANNTELSEKVELLGAQVKELGTRAERLEQDKNALKRQVADKDDAISLTQLSLQQVEEINADADAQLLLLRSQNDKLDADFEKQEGISLQLKTLLQNKDAEISSLLSCRDGQMSGYLEQLQANYRSQSAVYEDRLASMRYKREKADGELRTLEAKVKSLQIQVGRSNQDKEQMVAKMESFKNSMVSLQSERERLISEYRTLEAKSQLGLAGKDGGADGEGGASKGLKNEIRKLLHQMDDLNSENAMLRAQLVRYREDLNQVLSLKDNQLKVLLKKQQDVIKTLETQKVSAEKQLKESRLDLQKEQEVREALRVEIVRLSAEFSEKERSTANEGRKMGDLHETGRKLAEAEDKYKNESNTLERPVELEQEVTNRRMAELVDDQYVLEQQLAEARRQHKDAKTQNESLCKAMAALQDNRDQLIEDFKTLRSRYDEELRASQRALNKVERRLEDAAAALAAFDHERDILVRKLKALESKDSNAELNKLLDELTKGLSEKERELKRAAVENQAYGRQLSAFSRSMASLQNDRDRLMDELSGAKRWVESRQGSSPVAPNGSGVQVEDGPEARQRSENTNEEEKDVLRCDTGRKDTPETVQSDEALRRSESENIRLHHDLQRCADEIRRRDHAFQKTSAMLQQAVEEKGSVAAQLRSVSQTLRDTQNRCQWLEPQLQGSAYAEVAPGAPHERSDAPTAESAPLRERLLELELSLANERARRETAESALRLSDSVSRDPQRDVSIEVDLEEGGWDAVGLDPAQPLITRKVKGGAVACRRWLRGRSLYFSKLLTGRARSRYFFLAYLFSLHVLVLLCLTGVL